MPDPKELFQKFYDDLIDLGVPEKRAGEMAYAQMRDAFADMADAARDRAKEQR